MWMNKCEKRKEEKISILQKKKERKKKANYHTELTSASCVIT